MIIEPTPKLLEYPRGSNFLGPMLLRYGDQIGSGAVYMVWLLVTQLMPQVPIETDLS